MALKRTDNKQNRGWRKFKDENFGADDMGHGFASNWLNSYVSKHTIVPPREMDGSSAAIGFTMIGTTLTTALVVMASTFGGIVYDIGYDAPLETANTAFVTTDALDGVNDESGVLLTYSQEHGYIMLRREGDFYQVYQGRSVHGNDMAYRLISDEEVSIEITADFITELSASMDYPDIVGFNGVTYGFEAISNYYKVDAEDGIYRAVDERSISIRDEVWTQENLKTIFSEANHYFEGGGNYMVAYLPEIYETHLLEGPLDKNDEVLKILLAGFGLFTGAGAGLSLIQANSASRKRYRKETKNLKP